MHLHVTDQYRPRRSRLHALDVRARIILTLLFILTANLTPNGSAVTYAVLLLLVLGAAQVSRIGLGYVLKRSAVAMPFALAAITLPFTMQGQTIATVPILGGLEMSQEGLVRFLSIFVKSWISVQAAVLLVAVSRFPDLVWGLQSLRVPPPLVAIVAFMYRYLFVLSDEALRLIRARSARSASLPGLRKGGKLWWRGRVAGRMAGSLMIRSMERSERIHQAMIARGYRGELRTTSRTAMRAGDYLSIAAGALLLSAILLLGYGSS